MWQRTGRGTNPTVCTYDRVHNYYTVSKGPTQWQQSMEDAPVAIIDSSHKLHHNFSPRAQGENIRQPQGSPQPQWHPDVFRVAPGCISFCESKRWAAWQQRRIGMSDNGRALPPSATTTVSCIPECVL